MINKLIKFFYSKELRTFSILSLFHLSLYFSTSNKITFLFSIFLLVALYQHLKKLPLTLFYVFLIMLPFAKGKGIDILLLDKKYVINYSFFNISYLFPLYLSTFYLSLFYLYILRTLIFTKIKMNNLSKENKLVISIFLLFIITSCAGSISNIFEIPIFLSSMQLVILLLIFFIPFVLRTFYMKLNDFYMVIANSTLFQSIWLTLQTLNNGHLNRDIEVFLFSSKISIQSSENSNLLRLPGTFYESSILGTFLITNISILILYLINNNKIQMRKKTMIFLSIAMGTIAIILTGSRAIYLISFLILIILLKTKHCLSKDKIKALILSIKKIKLIIPIIFAILFVWPYFINRISSANQVFSKEGSGSYRIQLSEYALKLTDKKPLFGVGLNLSEFYLATSFPGEDYFFDAAYPHNIIIQILAETGLVGITLFIYFIYLILFRPTIKRNLNNFNEFHLASIVFLMCAQFYPIFINHMEIISYLFLYLGFAAFSNQKKYMKNKKVIVIPFTLPWDWSADFQRQTCLELARKNIQVFAYMSDDSYFFIKNKKRHYPKIKNVSFYVPRYYVPLRRFKIIEELNKYLSLIIFTCKIFSKKKIVWIFDPQFHYFPKFFKNSKSLYDCVDFFGIEHESDENKLINNTDMLFVNSHTLLSFHKNKIKNIFLVPQGFNSSEFNKNIKLIKKSKNNKKPIIGYAGGINYRIDYKLLIKLISRNPQWNFSFWGPIQECQKEKLKDILRQIKKLKQFSNVQFSSTKNKLKLMNAINSFDVCIIPYDIKQSFNLNSYPMKVFEYFYLGKPVISTKISELKLEKFKDLIFTSNNSKSWEKKIKNILDSPWPAKLKNKQRTLAIENSWENKVNKILEIII